MKKLSESPTFTPPRGMRDIESTEMSKRNWMNEQIQKTMEENVLVVRSGQSLEKCRRGLERISESFRKSLQVEKNHIFESLETENLLDVAQIMVGTACTREESRGSHYRDDYPMLDSINWNKVISIRSADGEMRLSLIGLPKFEP